MNDNERRLKAAEAFVEAWTDTALVTSLIADYGCNASCVEAEALAELISVFGYTNMGAEVMADHVEAEHAGMTCDYYLSKGWASL